MITTRGMEAVQRIVQWQLFVPVLILLVLATRVLLAFLTEIELLNDPAAYHQYAIWLGQGYGYLDIPTGEPTAYWPVGFPAFLGGVYFLFGAEPLSGELANSLLSALALWLAYDIARQLFNELTGRYLVLLLALYPANWYYSLHLASEMLALTLVLLTIALALRRGIMLTVASGLVAGLAFLVKPQTIAVAGIVWLFAMGKQSGQHRSLAYWGKWLGMYLVLVVVALPWGIRNYQVFDHVVPVSTNSGINLFIGNNPQTDGAYQEVPELHELMVIKGEVARDQEAKKRAIAYIKQDPMAALARMPAKLYALYGADFETSYKGKPVFSKAFIATVLKELCNLYYYGLMLLALVGIGVLAKQQGFKTVLNGQAIPLVCSLWFTAIYMMFFGTSRFHFLMVPLLAMYGAWLITVWESRSEEQQG